MRHERQTYSETLRLRVPAGLADAIARAAAGDLTSSSEFVRRALVAHLRGLGIDPGHGDNGRGPRQEAA